MNWKVSDPTWQAEEEKKAKRKRKTSGIRKQDKRGEEEEEEDIVFVLDMTEDPALQEDFLPFENECYYCTDDEDDDDEDGRFVSNTWSL